MGAAGGRARRRRGAIRGRASPRARARQELCAAAATRLRREPIARREPPPVPAELGRAHGGAESTQQSVRPLLHRPRARGAGRRRARRHGQPRRRVVDEPRRLDQPRRACGISASGSTGSPTTRDTLVRWRESEHGQHIELGIAEGNLVGLLGELGATWSRDGQPLLPIGTLYDPFVNRALEPWSFGIYAGGQSILVGTPSGRDARAGGRRAPVDHHAVGRARAAALHRPGSRRSGRTSSGRCCRRSRGSGARTAARRTSA